MSLTPIYDDLMRELEGIMDASKSKEPVGPKNAERAAEQELDDPTRVLKL
jgi:hypothetical protein